MGKSNIGQYGKKSIRLRGLPIEELPLGLGNDAAVQVKDVEEYERLNAVAEVKANYPHQRIDFLSARINESEENKNRMRKHIAATMQQISEYRGLIMKCEVRDNMLADLDESSPEYKEKRRSILKTWGRWDAAALQQQIEQFNQDIERCEEVVDKEDGAIKEHSEYISLCRERDRKLAALGETPAGS